MDKFNSKGEQHYFHMFPQSLMKYFFDEKNNEKGFLSYDFKTNKISYFNKPLGINQINSLYFKNEIQPINLEIFEKTLSKIESEYASFLTGVTDCTKTYNEVETKNEIFNTKIVVGNEANWETFQKKWRNYKNKERLNLAQFFYYLTIQLKYFNSNFIDGIIEEEKINKLLIFLKLNFNKKQLLTNDEKQWFSYMTKLRDFTYLSTFVIESDKKILNFNHNTRFSCAFTSNPISIRKMNNNVIIFVLPISFTKSIVIAFTKKGKSFEKIGELIFKEGLAFKSLTKDTQISGQSLPWRYNNYNFWNNEEKRLVPNGNKRDTRLIYYPSNIFLNSLNFENIIKRNEAKYKENQTLLEQNEKIIINKKNELIQNGSLYILICMQQKYNKNIEYDDSNFSLYLEYRLDN